MVFTKNQDIYFVYIAVYYFFIVESSLIYFIFALKLYFSAVDKELVVD